MVQCIFQNCTSKYNNAGSLRNHYYLKHKDFNNLHSDDMKPSFKLILPSYNNVSPGNLYDENLCTDVNMNPDEFSEASSFVLDDDDSLDGSISDQVEEEDLDHAFMMAYCDFLNRLHNFQFIPQSSIKTISEEYLKNYLKSNEEKSRCLKRSLMKHFPTITDVTINEILNDLVEGDHFLKAQKELGTDHKRMDFIKKNFKFIGPKAIIFNQKDVIEKKESKAVMHYVPITETIKTLAEDPTFYSLTESFIPDNEEDILSDVKDGFIYKNIKRLSHFDIIFTVYFSTM